MIQNVYVPAQRDLVWVCVDPRDGREQSGDRPALVLSQQAFCAVTGYALIAPVTSRIRGWPFEVLLPADAGITGAVLVDQTRSMGVAARHVRFAESTPAAALREAPAKLSAIVAPQE